MKPSLAFRVVVTVLLVAVVVGFALSIHRQERAENETALCLANIRLLTIPFLCLTPASPETVRLLNWQNPRRVLEELLGKPIPACPSGGEYLLRYLGESPGATHCICSYHGDLLRMADFGVMPMSLTNARVSSSSAVDPHPLSTPRRAARSSESTP
jgi:hypothetical protein